MAGVRSSKTVGSTTYKYDTLSGKVMRQSWGGNVIDFIYDENNQPFAFKYNGTVYYYVLNVQGDVIGLLNANGAISAKYTYDPWGKVTVQSSNVTANTSSAFIGSINPLCRASCTGGRLLSVCDRRGLFQRIVDILHGIVQVGVDSFYVVRERLIVFIRHIVASGALIAAAAGIRTRAA